MERWHFENWSMELERRSHEAVDEVTMDRLARSMRIAGHHNSAWQSIGVALVTLWCSLSLRHA